MYDPTDQDYAEIYREAALTCKDLLPLRVAAVLGLRRWLFYDTPMPAFLMRLCFPNMHICIRDSALVMYVFVDQTQAKSLPVV